MARPNKECIWQPTNNVRNQVATTGCETHLLRWSVLKTTKVRNAIIRFASKLTNDGELTATEAAWKRVLERVYLKHHKQFDPQWTREESYQCSLLAMLELERQAQLHPTYVEMRCKSRHLDSLRYERRCNRWKYAKSDVSGKISKRKRVDEYTVIDKRNNHRRYTMKHTEQLISELRYNDPRFAEIARLVLVEDFYSSEACSAVGVSRQHFQKMKRSAAKFMKKRAEQLRSVAELFELFSNFVEGM